MGKAPNLWCSVRAGISRQDLPCLSGLLRMGNSKFLLAVHSGPTPDDLEQRCIKIHLSLKWHAGCQSIFASHLLGGSPAVTPSLQFAFTSWANDNWEMRPLLSWPNLIQKKMSWQLQSLGCCGTFYTCLWKAPIIYSEYYITGGDSQQVTSRWQHHPSGGSRVSENTGDTDFRCLFPSILLGRWWSGRMQRDRLCKGVRVIVQQ